MYGWGNKGRTQVNQTFFIITASLILAVVIIPPQLYGEFDNSQLIEDARAGDCEAQYTLAHLLLKGQGGVRRDAGAAIKWFERSASNGHKDAPFDLALLYLDGTQIPKDNPKALYWLHQAADAGNSEAQYYLAQAYKASNVERAVIWLKKAAEAGHQMAGKDLKAWCEDIPLACQARKSVNN